MKRAVKIVFVTMIVTACLIIISVPLVNNYIALTVKSGLIKLPLPDTTELMDSASIAGKLVGDGNGMQYFGAVLIKSQLELDELEDYYSQYRENDWSYLVEVQTDKHIDVIERGDFSFNNLGETTPLTNHYIVYTWGSSNYLLSDFDLRGH